MASHHRPLAQAAGDAPLTHILVNTGVGGLAAAVCAHLWQRLGASRPRFVSASSREGPTAWCTRRRAVEWRRCSRRARGRPSRRAHTQLVVWLLAAGC
eukprot:4892162-Prymnesium_polylepis.1